MSDAQPRSASAFAPGKLILSGEHAVVYGHPAVALAVDRGTRVRLRTRPGPSGLDHPGDPPDPRLDRALAALLPPQGVAISLHSELPIGRGMGSSAALAVALVRALARWEGREASLDECVQRGFLVERIFHGTPSGIDHTVSALGGALVYRQRDQGPTWSPLDLPPLRLVVLDSGSAGDTARMVARVRARRPTIDPLLDRIGALTGELIDRLSAGARGPVIGPLLTRNHRTLQAIGVSTDALDALVRMALDAGAHGAKLAGAGGGGVVIALVDDPQPLLHAAAQANVAAFSVRVPLPPPSTPTETP